MKEAHEDRKMPQEKTPGGLLESGGGNVLVGPKGLAGGRFAVIEDPAGGVAAIYEV